MEQEFSRGKTVCIIGYGASGSLCAYFLLEAGFSVVIFDKGEPLRTILPTGGGRCNLAHDEYDFRELVKNYPRGEKFLYSVFSKFSTYDTIEVFNKIGIKTYAQDDGRIFPVSNNSKEVRDKLLSKTQKAKLYREEVKKVVPLPNGYKIVTKEDSYLFETVIIAIGGHSGYNILSETGISVVKPKPALVGLKTKIVYEKLSGVVVKNCICENCAGDILFTHYGLSGPLIYKISSIKALDEFPYSLEINMNNNITNLQESLNRNPHKALKNILSEYIPQRLGLYLLKKMNINSDIQACFVDGKTREKIINEITKFKITVIGTDKGEEVVTAGGINLNEIIPQTMQFKKFSNLYATGEVLDIDGFCGGFNLQNAWSTAYVAAQNIILYNSYNV